LGQGMSLLHSSLSLLRVGRGPREAAPPEREEPPPPPPPRTVSLGLGPGHLSLSDREPGPALSPEEVRGPEHLPCSGACRAAPAPHCRWSRSSPRP
jgi:hypothetical protein